MKSALLVTNIFPPMIGGPATFIDRAAHRLAADGVKVTVICSSHAAKDPADAARPFRVIRIPLRNRVRYEFLLRKALFWQLLSHRTVLVNGLETQVQAVARRLRRRYVLKIVGDTVWETARNQGRTCLDIDAFQTDPSSQTEWKAQVDARNRYVHGASKVITPSHYLRRMVIGWGVPPERVVVVHNGVEMEGDVESRRKPLPRAQDEPLRVLFVGRLTNWKGVETLLLAVKDLPRVQVTIVGDGPAWPHLVAFKEQLGIGDGVQFTGRVSAEAAKTAMGQNHLLVLTSLYEGLSHTLLEAGSMGVPCIASASGGNDEVIVHEENGLLVPAQDVPALREAIARIEADEPFRLRLASCSLIRSRQFDLRQTVERYKEELIQ